MAQIAFEPYAALLLCSDGLSDLVHSASIAAVILQYAGDPDAVVRGLVELANDAGGKDNITAVYLEGEQFAASQIGRASKAAVETRRTAGAGATVRTPPARVPGARRSQLVRAAIVVLLLVIAGAGLWARGVWPSLDAIPSVFRSIPSAVRSIPSIAVLPATGNQVVQPTESIAAAIARAAPGSEVLVEPGEYREQLVLRDNIRVVSRVPRGAIIRLPATASEVEAAVHADGLSAAEIVGFRIVGDAATPLGVGLLVRNSAISILDVEISGATKVAVDVAPGAAVSLVGSEIRDNPGAALAIRAGAAPRIAHGWFARNGTAERGVSLIIEPGASPQFERNVFQGSTPDAFAGLDEQAREALRRQNWFPRAEPAAVVPAAARPRAAR